jgi:hypothetical protein
MAAMLAGAFDLDGFLTAGYASAHALPSTLGPAPGNPREEA